MKKYIITSYIPGAEVNEDALNTLEFMAEDIGAEMLAIPTKSNYKELQNTVPHSILPTQGGFYLNSNLYVSEMLINVNLVDPISGLESISSEMGSLVVAAPRHRFKSVARSLKHNKTPRGIWCTGTISNPDYKDTKSGLRVRGYHTFGALLVLVKDNEIFSIRQLTYSIDSKSVCDLNKEYTLYGEVKQIRPSISLGDLHPPFTSPSVLKRTKRLLSELQVEKVIFHDSFDGASISHHVEGKHLTKALIQKSLPSLEEEVDLTQKVMNEVISKAPNDSEFYVVKSNHDEHLDKYLDEFRFKIDYTNLLYALDLTKQKVLFKRKEHPEDCLEYALKDAGLDERFVFLERDDKLDIAGIECSNHGDYGPNGARGNAKSQGLAFTGGKTITGHAHTPEIGVYGNYVNGTMTHLTLPYTNDSGTSGWINSHTLIYPNGSMTHFHIIEG